MNGDKARSKVAYFIQMHANIPQALRLINTIKRHSPDSVIIIGHDSRNIEFDSALIAGMADVYLLRYEFEQNRGDFSLIRPYLCAIDWMLEKDIDFDWLFYISGQHYPTVHLSEVEHVLASTPYDGFLSYWSMNSERGKAEYGRFVKRYYYQYYRVPEKYTFAYRVIEKLVEMWGGEKFSTFPTYGNLVGVKSKIPPFNESFKCYRGFLWTILSSKCVRHVSNYVKENKNVIEYFKRTVCSDEAFVQTILANSGEFNLCDDSKLYHRFNNSPDGRPDMLGMTDYEELVSGKYWFARKFDPDAEVLAKLDRFLDRSVGV